jgi:two-component system sensor histidine kinase RegB
MLVEPRTSEFSGRKMVLDSMILHRSTVAPRIALPWIVRLRYCVAAGQMITALVVNFLLGIHLPLILIAIPPGLVALSNYLLSERARQAERSGYLADSTLVAAVFVLDTLCLTALLMLAGGPNNPFTLLYLVHITLSAIILTQRQTWALGVLACFCFASLFWVYRPIPQLEMHHRGNGANLHLMGMWVGFAVATLLVTMFSGKISGLLHQHEESLLFMQEQLAKKDRLAALVTLAAGAAHELNTPLGTIAVVAKDLERYATNTVRDGAVAEDSRLIRAEVDRCCEILRRMSEHGAEPAGEAPEDTSISTLVEVVRCSLADRERLRIDVSKETANLLLRVPKHAVQQALIALLKNAFEAGPENSLVDLKVKHASASVYFEVQDRGVGIGEENLRHVGEPFFTTKEPGKGMGLGVFLVRTLANRLGGSLTVSSSANQGTSATLQLPLMDTTRSVAI